MSCSLLGSGDASYKVMFIHSGLLIINHHHLAVLIRHLPADLQRVTLKLAFTNPLRHQMDLWQIFSLSTTLSLRDFLIVLVCDPPPLPLQPPHCTSPIFFS